GCAATPPKARVPLRLLLRNWWRGRSAQDGAESPRRIRPSPNPRRKRRYQSQWQLNRALSGNLYHVSCSFIRFTTKIAHIGSEERSTIQGWTENHRLRAGKQPSP